MDFSTRSYQTELLDDPKVPADDIVQNMKELDFINTFLGGHAVTLSGFRNLLTGQREITVCEIGCGGADNLMALRKWTLSHGISARFIGIDINPHCLEVARRRFPTDCGEFILSDYQQVDFGDQKPDLLFSSLFCHHFTQEQLLIMLQWMRDNSTIGFFINDLHRHPFAYYSIRALTGLFSRSYLVKNDAPLSVLRGFTKKEWDGLLQDSGIRHYCLQWKWAFRWLITVKHIDV